MALAIFLTALAASLSAASAKVYTRCELARELVEKHEIPRDQVATWVCIARYEAEFNTSAVNRGSGDHGLFQISHLYWCSPVGHACGLPCSALEDDDIEDDVICARRIFRQHQRISGDGFSAWAVYGYYCKKNAERFVQGCFDGEGGVKTKAVEKKKKVQNQIEGISSVTPSVNSAFSTFSSSVGAFNYHLDEAAAKARFKAQNEVDISSVTPSVKSAFSTSSHFVDPFSYQDVSAKSSFVPKFTTYKTGKQLYSFAMKSNGFVLKLN